MSFNHHHICGPTFFLRLSLLLFLTLPLDRMVAQTEDHKIDIRVGRGTTMTSPVLTSVYLSLPEHLLTDEHTFPAVYLDKSVVLSEEKRRLDFIVGVAPMIQFEFTHDVPRITFEAGVGVNVVSSRHMGGRQLGSNFLFSPTLSAGVEVPWMNGHLGIFYMFRHLSNASMFEDNDGINFQYIVFTVSFNNN